MKDHQRRVVTLPVPLVIVVVGVMFAAQTILGRVGLAWWAAWPMSVIPGIGIMLIWAWLRSNREDAR